MLPVLLVLLALLAPVAGWLILLESWVRAAQARYARRATAGLLAQISATRPTFL